MTRPRTKPDVGLTRKERGPILEKVASCVLCGGKVSVIPGQYHFCLTPVAGPAHKRCAKERA